jgi:hypothetical protein
MRYRREEKKWMGRCATSTQGREGGVGFNESIIKLILPNWIEVWGGLDGVEG